MKRVICGGCGVGENIDEMTGRIRSMQFVDTTPQWKDGGESGNPERTVTEDLCNECRENIRRTFFGVHEPELLDMPLMKVVT